jgi:DNA-binding CsgD family transcriptional regulator
LPLAKLPGLAYTEGMDRLTRADYAACLRLIKALESNSQTAEGLTLLRPHLAFLYRHADKDAPAGAALAQDRITPREREVLMWVASGKTDADIALLLAISRRTVHKHLEHIYIKLGVETRTAAVMRAHIGP